jgi:hypothetical protein
MGLVLQVIKSSPNTFFAMDIYIKSLMSRLIIQCVAYLLNRLSCIKIFSKWKICLQKYNRRELKSSFKGVITCQLKNFFAFPDT